MKKANWISIEDRLPEPEISVLCYCNHQNIFHEHLKWKHIGLGEKNSYDNYFSMDGSDTTFINVTHWMPLPEPPKQ